MFQLEYGEKWTKHLLRQMLVGYTGFQEKSLSFSRVRTVPQTDTGGQEEYSKALERNRVKELGKIAP